jgi:hypothetical protein
MPAQRWQSGIHEFFQTIGETDEEMMNTFMTSVFSRFQKKEDASSDPQADDKNEGQKFPDNFPSCHCVAWLFTPTPPSR